MSQNFFSFEVKDSKGAQLPLSNFKNKVCLVVNVASKCGFTNQYTGLEKLYAQYAEQGFTVIGFPCNQFGAQEPGSDQEIQEFCQLTYSVKFPVLAKVDVNGDNAAPVYGWLKSSAPGILGTEAIKWNFTKFLIGRDGQVIQRYAPQTKPEEIAEDIKKALG
jgi:glutathione peroxidase